MPLRVMVLGFALMPLASLAVTPPFWLLLRTDTLLTLVLTTFAFWIAPLSLCYLIFARSFVMVPLFWLECAALLANYVIESDDLPLPVSGLRCLLLIVVAAGGLWLLRRDVLYPLLVRRDDRWRRAPRLKHRSELEIIHQAASDERVLGVVENCSATGIAISVDIAVIRPILQLVRPGDALNVRLHIGPERADARFKLIWYVVREDRVRLGLETDETAAIERLAAFHKLELWPDAKTIFGRAANSRRVRIALVYGWIGAMVGSLILPAIGLSEAQNSLAADVLEDAALPGTIAVPVTVTYGSYRDDSLTKLAEKIDFEIATTGCSGHVPTPIKSSRPSPILHLDAAAVGCHLVIKKIRLNGVAYSSSHGGVFATRRKAVNLLESIDHASLMVVTVADLPSPVTPGQSARIHVMEVDMASAHPVPLPQYGCTVTVGKQAHGGDSWHATVTVHPAYLPYVKTVSLKSCTPNCSTQDITDAKIIGSDNEFTVSGSTMRALYHGHIELNNAVMAASVEAAGKSLTCRH